MSKISLTPPYKTLNAISQIQQYLEELLNKAQAQSTLSYLRVLQLAHVQTSKLVEDLKAYDFSSTVTSRTASELGSPDLAGTAMTSNPTVAIGTMLENAMEELFVPYNEGTKYIEKECKIIGDLYATSLERFTKYHVRPGSLRISLARSS